MNDNPNNLRIIKTARTKEAINKAAKEGYWPLVKPVIPSPYIKRKFAVLQNSETGGIEVINDYRATKPDMDKVVDFTFYYPHHFDSPYAAYLIPTDLKVGEMVWIEDLIADVVSGSWNQGDTYRLSSCEAVWDGSEFDLLTGKIYPLIKIG